MTKNLLTDIGYRKLDVDAFDPDKFIDFDDQNVIETQSYRGLDENQIRQLLQTNRNLEALKTILTNPQLETKNQVLWI